MTASQRARRLYPSSTAFQGAYRKGAAAKRAGLSASACPYRIKANAEVGWTRSFRRAWLAGWISEEG